MISDTLNNTNHTKNKTKLSKRKRVEALMGIDASNRFGPILKEYNIHPLFIEEHGNVKKVFTNRGTYALKTIKNKLNAQFPTLLQFLYKQGYTRAVPIFPTLDGRYVVNNDNQYYYLMPWLENITPNEREDRHQELFKELARLHLYSAQEIPMKEKDNITKHYETIKNEWDSRDHYFEAFVQECEKKWYMSPFELMFCTYYYETSLASKYARAQLDKWKELMDERDSYRTVLTNGNVSITHFLYDETGKGYLTNFENAKMASPINDLVGFYYRTLKTYPILCDDCFKWFQIYRSYFPLKEDEIYLFLSYLTYPEPIFKVVHNYITKPNKKSEQEYVKLLQRAYWLNKNIEYFASKIVEEEQRRKELEEQLKQQQEQQETHTE